MSRTENLLAKQLYQGCQSPLENGFPIADLKGVFPVETEGGQGLSTPLLTLLDHLYLFLGL